MAAADQWVERVGWRSNGKSLAEPLFASDPIRLWDKYCARNSFV